ncbi:drug/metabolite transporter (DMT)-like permease [Leifsonia sp. AK011]|uniref:DMT family transporter n=1 Tax=Leifsonia sp. AK011 TaxID=2723075 RepID=UPI0015C6E319|nr:DMT family transporter [Leifsonia sp. AK011]NYF09470.1 drug/metabolite transporter (DMT)-like permease [Leifsonia sp. AK011]
MLTVIVGLTSALVYGAADFLGGLAAKRLSAITVTAIVALSGLVVVVVVGLPIVGGVWSPEAVLLGALSGVAGAVAIGLLYACLAIGPMSILSPLTAVVSAIVPLTIGLLGGERLGTLGYIALGLALVAIVLVGFTPPGRGELVRNAVKPSLTGVLMAVGSGTAIGIFLIIIDETPDDSGIVPLVANRATNSAIMFTLVGVLALIASRRGKPRGSVVPTALWLAIAGGVLDAAANTGLLFGVRLGELSVIAVLTALYPAGTIILAAIVLKERIAVLQYVGLVLAIVAGAMLALA